MDRIHARLAARARPATGFTSQPEPRTIGHFSRGRQLVAGNFLVAGRLIEAPDTSIWDIPTETHAAEQELQGCTWLDDLAAVGDARAQARAQAWVYEWIRRYGRGGGPGWTPDLTGRRLIRWINHAIFLLRGRDKADSDEFYGSLARQTIFLSRRWKSARSGLPRFEALTGMIYAGLGLTGMERHVAPAVAALAQDCRSHIDRQGGIPTRNPEELLEVFTLLTWAAQALSEAGHQPPQAHMEAIDPHRADAAGAAPCRWRAGAVSWRRARAGRAARYRAGLLRGARAAGAGAAYGLWSHVGGPHHRHHRRRLAAHRRGFVGGPCLDAGVRADIGAPAADRQLRLRPELWRRMAPGGPRHGQPFDAWHRGLFLVALRDQRAAGRAGARIAGRHPGTGDRRAEHHADGYRFELAHNGYQPTHGLTHARTLDLSGDGRAIVGEDLLTTMSSADKLRFDRANDDAALQGIAFSVRFHLHPEVDAAIDLGGAAVSLALKSGEIWIFRQDGAAEMTLEQSVYLENGRLRPRATQQVVLSGRAMSYATRVRWSLAKAQDTPNAMRDLVQEDPRAGPMTDFRGTP